MIRIDICTASERIQSRTLRRPDFSVPVAVGDSQFFAAGELELCWRICAAHLADAPTFAAPDYLVFISVQGMAPGGAGERIFAAVSPTNCLSSAGDLNPRVGISTTNVIPGGTGISTG